MTPLSHGRNELDDAPALMSRVQDTSASPADAARSRPHRLPGREGSINRKHAFAAFVRQALDDARTVRAWTGTEVARRTGISRQTIHRWMRGDWSTDPEPERVVAFCEGLGLRPSTAFGILGWDRSASARAAAAPMDPDVDALLRRLLDPDTSDAEKYHIRETVRYLAYRPRMAGTQGRMRQEAS